ncbi:MAG TPA: hypothetical protein VHF22_02520, partial [Planctomycetota bacterium]|nr:hypothetical protein [Planctomycetota bacterium]
AALALAALPMTVVYGGLVNYEPFVLAAMGGTYLAYLRWRETGAPRDLAATCALFALAILCDWFGAFVGPAIALHTWLVKPRAPRWFVPLLAAIGLATVAAVLGYYVAIYPTALEEIRRQASLRTGTAAGDDGGGAFGLAAWLARQGRSLNKGDTLPGLALWLAAFELARRSGREDLRRLALHAGLLALVGLQAIAVFPQASFTHEFLSFPLGYSVAIGIAISMEWLGERWGRVPFLAVAVVFLATAQALGWSRLDRTSQDEYPLALGREIAAIVPFEWGVGTPEPDGNIFWPAMFYADRRIYPGLDSLEKLDAVRASTRGKAAPLRFVALTDVDMARCPEMTRSLLARVPCARSDRLRLAVFDLGPP